MKNLLSERHNITLLSLLLLLILFPLTASAAIVDSGKCGDNLTWTVYETFELVIEGSGKMTDHKSYESVPWYRFASDITRLTLPDGLTNIGDNAFFGCQFLSSINIPNSVTSIGEHAFEECCELTSVTIGNSVTSIGGYAFSECDELKTLTFGNSVTSIGEFAFLHCFGLTSVNIPNSVTSIGRGAFAGCGNLTSVNIPNSVTSIGEAAFEGCALTHINFPNSMSSIGEYAFMDCYDLKEITCEAETPPSLGRAVFNGTPASQGILYVPASSVNAYKAADQWKEWGQILPIPGTEPILPNGRCGDNLTWTLYEDGELRIEGSGRMTDFENSTSAPWQEYKSAITKLTLPDGLTSIGVGAFKSCFMLTSINIPNSVATIGDKAFWGCFNLASVSIPNSVTTIGDEAFKQCENLASINIPNSVATIDHGAFKDCSNLASVSIPNSVTTIGAEAFWGCISLTAANIPNTVTTIGDGAFAYCPKLETPLYNNRIFAHLPQSYNGDYEIPNGIETICGHAFVKCYSLTSINIPNSVTSIGDDAFYGCSALASVTIPNSVTSIGTSTFYDCPALTSVTIPNSVTSIGSIAFSGCTNLKEIICENQTPPSMGSSVFYNSPVNEGILYVPASSVNAYKAANQWKSWGQILPIAGTDPILASGNCGPNLTWSIYKSGELRIEGSGAMDTYKDAQSVPWYEYCKSITQLSLPEGLSSIGDFAFNGCSSLTSVILPNSVTSVGFYAFAGCDGLTTPVKNSKLFVYMPASYKGAYDIPNGIETIGKLAFKGCGELTNVNIPATVTSIGSSAFEGCAGLSSISIPATVTEIEMWAFQGCTGLESVTIGNGVAVIGEFAFYGCTRITSITLPQSVTRINSYAFNECNELREMVCKASTPPTVKSSAFGETTLEKGQLYVLGPCVNAYKAADGWKEWRQIRPIPGTEVLFTITAESADKALGTVRGGGMFVEGETVTLTATASEDYRFTAWSDGSTSNPYTFTATRNVTLTASFEQLPPSERKMLELTDDMDYATIPAKKYESLEYLRQSGNAGQWEALSVPMRVDVMQNSQQAEFGEVYAVAPCRDTNGDGKVDEQDEYCVIVRKMDKGELQPNMPYFIRPLNDGGLKLQSVDNQFHDARTRPLSISVVTRIYSFIPQKQARNLNGKDEYVLEDAWLSGGPKAKGMGRPSRWVMSITPENPDKDSLPGVVGLFTLDEDVIETVVNGKRQFILLDDDTETAIDLARQQDSRGIHGAYTLDGRKMPDMQHLQPGIYIVNGKKVSSQHILSR